MAADLILVCDPDTQSQRALRSILRDGGYKVRSAVSGQEALAAVAEERPRAIIAERSLPDISGVQLCARLRQTERMPIIVVSRAADEATMVEALTLQKSGNSTPFWSKIVSPVRQLVWTTSRRSQVTSSYGCVPGVVYTRSIARPAEPLPVVSCACCGASCAGRP